ncbi:DUF2470 domain-containing protein [Jiangella mangrovi]|uniref:Putative heme iron utilization protein n=1 Tax=Jiangella mangrovi TaxID=1524084 RepID=A0A7W9LKZ7_9ACTN|nr:putative heme iron utilization protein [Jiangella mangrovi]
MSQNPFGPDVIAAVSRHMNDDHTADSLVIVQALGDTPEATAARVVHLDGVGVDFAVTVDGAERTVRVPFARPLTERPEIRVEFVRLYTEAATALGIEPRAEG